MAIVIAKPSSFTKGENHTIRISRAEVLAIPKVANDPYFNNVSKWKSIEFHFYGNPENEIEVVKFKANITQPSGIFSVSTKSSNSFELSAITIHDFDGGMLVVDKEDFPEDASLIFDIQFPVELPVTPTLTSSAGVGTINLSWTPLSQYNDYSIWKKTGSAAYVRIQNEFSSYSYVDSDIVGNQTYRYYITQNWDDDFILTSNEVTIVTIKPATPVVTPTYIPATSDITVGWNDVQNTQTYFIYRSTVANTFPESSKIAEVPATDPRTYTDTTPAPATTYYYAMRAIGNFASDLSNIATLTTVGSFNISQFKATSQTAATISWTTSANATAYKLFYRKVGEATWIEIDNVTSPRAITGLTAGDYETYVVARNSQSTFTSATANAEIPIQPTAPVGVSATSWEDARSTITWSSTANTDRYFIYRSGSQNGVYTKISETTTLSFINTGLSNSVTYWYKISAINDAADLSIESPLSTAASGTPDIPTITVSGMNGTHPDYYANVSTNAPASMVLRFEIEIFNASGVMQGSTYISGSGISSFQSSPNITLAKNTAMSIVGKLYCNDGRIFTRDHYAWTKSNTPTTIAATGGSSIQVNWTAGVGNVTYDVFRNTSNSSVGASQIANGITSTSYIDTLASGDTNFYYFVRAFNGSWVGNPPAGYTYTGGHSSISSDLSSIAGPAMKLIPAQRPKFWGYLAIPTSSTISNETNNFFINPNTSQSPNTVNLRMIFQENDVQSVRIYESSTQTGTYTLVDTINNPTLNDWSSDSAYEYLDRALTGKTSGTTYWYNFEYTKLSGATSPRSYSTSIYILPDASTLTPTISNLGATSLTLSWPGIAIDGSGYGYEIRVSTSPTMSPGATVTITSSSSISTTANISGLTADTVYYFQVLAWSQVGGDTEVDIRPVHYRNYQVVSAVPQIFANREFSNGVDLQGETSFFTTYNYYDDCLTLNVRAEGTPTNATGPNWQVNYANTTTPKNLTNGGSYTLKFAANYNIFTTSGMGGPSPASWAIRFTLGGTEVMISVADLYANYATSAVGMSPNYPGLGFTEFSIPLTAGSTNDILKLAPWNLGAFGSNSSIYFGIRYYKLE